MAYLELRDVYFEYPSGHVAVEGVSISADLGEKIAIIGEILSRLFPSAYPSKSSPT